MILSNIPVNFRRIRRWIFLLLVLSPNTLWGQITLYTYQSGNWNNIDVWTTDPGGTTLAGSKIPGNNDVVVVLPSRTLTLVADVSTTNLGITIREGAILDASSYKFSSGIASLTGFGKYRLKSADFPVADVNTFVNTGGGTVEYYLDSDFILPVSQTDYFNLIINCTGFIATQISNITVNGNLEIQSGTYSLNNGSANRRSLVIKGDVNINSGASLITGTGNTTTTIDPAATGSGGTAPFLDYYINQSHLVEIYGNFINNGIVRFTNQSFPVFNAFPSNGFASVFFRGAADKTITCNGTTDFYNLILDKGSDQTFILTVNSAGYDKFRIFGANVAAEISGSDASNPDIRKALWIRNGTLRLNGYVFIPSLVEGASSGSGDFFIPGNGALIIGGPEVVVMGTVDDYSVVNLAYGVNGGSGAVNGITTEPSVNASNISLYGKLQINEGKLYMGEIGRIIYFGTSAAQFIINGGIIDIKQFQSVSGGGKTAFWQSSGDLVLRGRFKRNLNYGTLGDLIASIGDESRLNSARATSGGGNPLGTDPAVGTLNIDQDANIFHMEGGNISIYDVTGTTGLPRALEINSDPANVNVSGGNIIINITSGSVLADADYGIASRAPLYNLTINRTTGTRRAILLAIPAKSGVTGVTNPPLTVINNLTLANTSGSANDILNSGNFDVITGGNFNIQADAVYTPGSNRTILNGSGDQTFTKAGTITSGLHKFIVDKNGGTATLGNDITVNDSLAIYGGTINDGGNILYAGGSIFNAGTHTGSGKLILNGTALQTITGSQDGSAALGNVEIRNPTSPAGVELSSDINVQTLTLTANTGARCILDIKTYNLNISAGIIASSGTLAFGASKMIRTSGNSSDKGLTQFITLSGNYTNQLIATFPLGVGSVYYPAQIYCNGNPGTVSGNYTIVPVNSIHPATDPAGVALPFYWRSKTTGFSGLNPNTISQWFYHSSISPPLNKSWYLTGGAWTEGTGASGGIASFTGTGLVFADFTAGKNSPFRNPTTYYSRQSGLFNIMDTWSTDPVLRHTGPAATSAPQQYDMIIIGGQSGTLTSPRTIANDSVTVTAVVNVASITINSSYTGDSRLPVLNIQSTTGHTIDIIKGGGKFCTSTASIPAADYGELLNSETGIIHYYGSAYTLPALSPYPNLLITGGNTKLLSGTTVIRKNLIIADVSNPDNVLSLNGTSGDLIVYGDVKFRNGGSLIVPLTGVARNINIYGNIDFTYGNTANTNTIAAISGIGTTHKLNFYGSRIYSGASSLVLSPAGTNKIDLYFKNPGAATISSGTGSFGLNRLFIQKEVVNDTVYFKKDFTLNEADNATSAKSITLTAGTLVLSDQANGVGSTINLNLSSGGTSFFQINSTSRLVLRNGSKINITGNTIGSGIRLDGILMAEGSSEINLADGGMANTGYIEYSGSGNAVLTINGSGLLKAAQIRRSLSLTTGLLKYTQTGTSAVTIFGAGTTDIVDQSRAKLEVTGTGSSFTMSGASVLSIISGGGTTFGDLFLRPEISSVTGGDIIFGTGTSGQVYKLDAVHPLYNVTVNAAGLSANELQLMVNPLVLNGNLLLNNTNSTLTSNNIDLTLKGNFINNGIYHAGTNTTTFNGSSQSISGSNDPLFRNLTVSPTVKLILNRDITVNGSIAVTSGILEASSFNLTVKGNVLNNGLITNSPAPATSRIYLNGTSLQTISGTGSFGRIELDNGSGARLGNDISLSEEFKLTNGILDINQFALTLGQSSFITGSSFGLTRMIKSDGVFSNGGVIKYFNGGYSGTFLYPVGVSGKYTPASLNITATSSGFVRMNLINSRHPATLAPYNVLNFYWETESSVTGFDGNLTVEYEPADVTGTESQYVAGRLIIPPGTGWSKAAAGPATDNVDEAAHTVYFNFPAGTSNLGGQFTAGYTSDLPNTIPVYTSNTVYGSWDSPSNWTPAAPAGGPNGFAVIIKPGNTVYTNGNRRFAFKTTINGTLEVGTSYGHNLGTVDGTGKLSLQQANLPAGDFVSFLGCSGGTLEYGGSLNYTIVADRIDTVRNLMFTGTGIRTLPDKDLVVCNQLLIDGPLVDNHSNRKLTVGGSFDLNSGSFLCGSGNSATITFNGTTPQSIMGFNGTSPLNNLEINNTAGLTLNSMIEMNGNLLLTNGVITTTQTNILRMTNQSATSASGSMISYVSGPVSKNQFGGVDFTFPTGKGSRFGKIKIVNPQSGIWEAEYFNAGYPDLSVTGTLIKAGSSEYWKLTSPSDGNTAAVQLRWDAQSDITPLTTTNGINDIRVAEYNGADWAEKSSSAPAGNDTDGTVQTLSNIPVNNSGHPRYYTLGSTSGVKPTITPGLSPVISRCVLSASLPYTAVTGSPDQYMIDFDAAANLAGFADVTWTVLPASPVLIAVPAGAAPGVYNAFIRVRSSVPVNQGLPVSFSITITPGINWTGSLSSDWNTAANWSCGSVPVGGTSITVPDVPNKPVLNLGSTGSVNNLTIDAGSSLTVTGNTLQIGGTITSNGTFTVVDGKIVLNGLAVQNIGANLFAGNTIKDLTVSNPAGVSLLGPLSVTGILYLQNGNLSSGGNLTLASTPSGTASIDGSGSGQVTGNVTMQRYLASGFGYKYFSSPFQAATVSEFGDDMNLASSFTPFYMYNENRIVGGVPVSGWVSYKNPANVLFPLSGYSINFGSDPAPKTIDVTGVVNNGNISVSLYNNNNTFTKGFNLAGNPYPSEIDWNAFGGWTKTNIDDALYFFRASATDQYGGIYSTYVNGVSNDGFASNIIPSMQGFFVHVSDLAYPVTGTLAMSNSVRVISNVQPFLKKSAFVSKALIPGEKSLLRISAGFSDKINVSDPLVIYYDIKATENFDGQVDALKNFNTDYDVPSFYSFGEDGSKLSVNALPETADGLQPVSLGLRTKRNGEVVFRMKELSGSFTGTDSYFFDAQSGETHKLVPGMEYKVFLNAGDYNSRFFLNFENLTTQKSQYKETDVVPFLLYSTGSKIIAEINCIENRDGTLTVNSLTGHALFIEKVNENGHHEFHPEVLNGIYIVSFVSGKFRTSQKLFIGVK